jgi:cytochrome c
MREQYFFNRRFQISLIVNCDRWAYLKGSARAEHHTDGGLGSVALALSEPRVLAQDSEALYTKKCANCHAKDGSGHTAVASTFARSVSRA